MANVGRDTIERAMEAIAASEVPMSASMVSNAIGISYMSAMRALYVLREQDRIHVARRQQPMVLPHMRRRAPWKPASYYAAGPAPDEVETEAG